MKIKLKNLGNRIGLNHNGKLSCPKKKKKQRDVFVTFKRGAGQAGKGMYG
jgi:hypothetical protein